MIIYLINIFSLLIYKYIYKSSNNKEKMKKILISLIVFQFTLIQGMRSYSIGNDTQNYVDYYNLIKNMDISFYQLILNPPLKFEQGWLHLMSLCSLLGFNDRMFIFLVSLITNSLFGFFIYKESEDFVMSYWIFICVEYFTLSFTMLRQMIAIGIIVNSYIFLKNQDYRKCILLNIFAILFHKTSAIFLLVILFKYLYDKFFYKCKQIFSFKVKLVTIAIFELSILLLGPIIKFVAKYFYGYYSFQTTRIGFQWIVMMGILILLLIAERLYEADGRIYYYQLFIFIASLIQLSTIYISLIGRIAYYFYIFVIVAIPYIARIMNEGKLKNYSVLIVYLLTFLQYYLLSMNMYRVTPYSIF